MTSKIQPHVVHYQCAVCGRGFLSHIELTAHQKTCPDKIGAPMKKSKRSQPILDEVEGFMSWVKDSGGHGYRER